MTELKKKSVFVVCAFFVLTAQFPATYAQEATGVKLLEMFKITQVAGDALATNVYCLSVSPKGETFVSGPGYIKVLIDSDGDLAFDGSRIFANGPQSGAQGICFDGTDLLCTGDGGLLRYRDADADGVADGPPEKIFEIKTGGEHDAHAIRKGPDGWWYLLAGNNTPILPEYFSGNNSPVLHPRAGFLMRISPDWTDKEIFAHGFRNAYDFDFNSLGQVFVFDSDGERDISLPWYRPTRLFRMRPGDDAGWVAAGWKRPSSFFDMPPEIGALGRGSPTGVLVCQSKAFPDTFRDAVFVADWTFGRIVAFQRNSLTGMYDQGGSDFAIATGQFGFAVTDMDFAADGSLLVSTGGRGTKGAVYRISFKSQVQKVEELGSAPNEVHASTDKNDLAVIANRDAKILQFASKLTSNDELLEGLLDEDRLIRESAMESLVGRRDFMQSPFAKSHPFFDALRVSIVSSSPKLLSLAKRVFDGWDESSQTKLLNDNVPVEIRLALEPANKKSFKRVVELLAAGESDLMLLSRIGQLMLGGCDEKAKPMFVGYAAAQPITFSKQELKELADQIATAIAGQVSPDNTLRSPEAVDELTRLAAMLECSSEKLHRELVGLFKTNKNAQQSIHWLNSLSQTINDRDKRLERSLEQAVADAVVEIPRLIERDGQDIDRNFQPRMTSLVNRLCARIGIEFSLMLGSRVTGQDDEVFLFDALTGPAKDTAIGNFAERVESDPSKATVRQIAILASQPGGTYVPLIRKFSDRNELQDVVIAAIAVSPETSDRGLFLSGLKSSSLPTTRNSAIGLRRSNLGSDPEIIVAAIKAASSLAWDKPSSSARDQLILLLENQTGKSFAYQGESQTSQTDAIDRWKEFVSSEFPDQFAAAFANPQVSNLGERLARVPWGSGDKTRGEEIYRALQCAQCHDAGSRLGPKLEGLASRFNRDDIFRAIAVPNEQVPDRYRAIQVETVSGQFYQGTVVYESVDGITLQETGGGTVRINQDDIESKTLSSKSLMPEGLLDEASDQDWADLYLFLTK